MFETAQAGIQRTDRWTGTTVTLWNSPAAAPALNSAVAFDASRWTPFGTYLTAEESWGAQPQPYGRLFELTNPTTAGASGGTLLHRNAVARVSHEGLAFDRNNNLYYIDELNGGSIYRYTSNTPNDGATFFDGGVNSVLRVGSGNTDNATGASSWVPFQGNSPLRSSFRFMPHSDSGLKPMMMTCPSGIRMRSTSRSIWCGSSLNSRTCGKTTRSVLSEAKGRAAQLQSMSTAPYSPALRRNGMRLARRKSLSH